MALDLDRAYGALGFEFHQNRLKKFKKGEVVLCMGVGNNYDLPFGWEAPFIYSKFVEVFDEHFVATEDGRFSIDRIFKVDKEYRFHVPQIDMHFISYFRMNVEVEGGLIHFNFIDNNPAKQNFAIPVDAGRDYIKSQLAYTDGIKLFELRKSSKSVTTKKAKVVKPVKAPSTNIHEENNQGTEIFGVWYNHKRPHELKKENSSFVVTWLDECEDNISTSRINLFKANGLARQVNEVHYWLLGQGFYSTNDQFRLPKKVVKILDENIPKVGEPKSNITGIHGCSCHPFDSWKECNKAHSQKFKIGDQVINRHNRKVGFITEINNAKGYYTVKYGERPVDHELGHAAGLELLVSASSKAVATKSIETVPVPSADQEPKTKSKIDTTAKRDKKGQKRDEMIKFRVTSELKEFIQEMAKLEQTTVADLIKNALKNYPRSSYKIHSKIDYSKIDLIK